jgi:hypothetical protein
MEPTMTSAETPKPETSKPETPKVEPRKPCLTGKFCKGDGYLAPGTNGMSCNPCRTHRSRSDLRF